MEDNCLKEFSPQSQLIWPIIEETKMNSTEKNYATRLEGMVKTGEIVAYEFEAIKFRLANNTFYTPDFMVVVRDQIEFHEVKGFWRDDARVKIKVAARLFPWFKFVACQYKKKHWIFEEF